MKKKEGGTGGGINATTLIPRFPSHKASVRTAKEESKPHLIVFHQPCLYHFGIYPSPSVVLSNSLSIRSAPCRRAVGEGRGGRLRSLRYFQ